MNELGNTIQILTKKYRLLGKVIPSLKVRIWFMYVNRHRNAAALFYHFLGYLYILSLADDSTCGLRSNGHFDELFLFCTLEM